MAIDIKKILSKNPKLNERMISENWGINYDKHSDVLIVGNKFPKGSESVYLNHKNGILIRVDENEKIYGFIIEDFKAVFLKKQKDKKRFYRICFIPDSIFLGRFLFILILAISSLPLAIFYLIRKSYLILSRYNTKKYSFISGDLMNSGFANC